MCARMYVCILHSARTDVRVKRRKQCCVRKATGRKLYDVQKMVLGDGLWCVTSCLSENGFFKIRSRKDKKAETLREIKALSDRSDRPEHSGTMGGEEDARVRTRRD